MMAHNVAPGLGRPFAFEKLQMFDKKVWDDLCGHSRARQRRRAPAPIFACDRSAKAIQAAETNVTAAGLAVSIFFKHADFLTIPPPADAGILIANPPYGQRMGDDQELARFYPLLGDSSSNAMPAGRPVCSPAICGCKLIGLSTSRRTPLFNGAIECRLYQFKLVKGGHRQREGLTT